MWKYIVIWVLLTQVEIPSQPTRDQFGRMSTITLSIWSYKIQKDTCVKIFSNGQQARKFYNAAKSQQDYGFSSGGFNSNGITDVIIDSIKMYENSTTGRLFHISDTTSMIIHDNHSFSYPIIRTPNRKDTLSMLSHNHF